MTVYMIIEIKITNIALYAEYVDRVDDIVVQHGGRYLVRGGEVTPVAGGWSPERMIIIEFPSREMLNGCFNSRVYKALAPLREQSTIGKAIIVDGVDCSAMKG